MDRVWSEEGSVTVTPPLDAALVVSGASAPAAEPDRRAGNRTEADHD